MVSFPYNPIFIAKVKTIEGRRWHPEGRYWSFPDSDGILKELLRIFAKEKVYIDPALRKRATTDLEDFRRELKIRKYSPKTIKSYIRINEDLLQRTKKAPEKVTNQDIKNYLLYLVEVKEASVSTVNCAINALKFHYGSVLKCDFIYEIAKMTLRSTYATHNTLSASLSAFGGTFWLSGCG
jgi:hypothetical protein